MPLTSIDPTVAPANRTPAFPCMPRPLDPGQPPSRRRALIAARGGRAARASQGLKQHGVVWRVIHKREGRRRPRGRVGAPDSRTTSPSLPARGVAVRCLRVGKEVAGLFMGWESICEGRACFTAVKKRDPPVFPHIQIYEPLVNIADSWTVRCCRIDAGLAGWDGLSSAQGVGWFVSSGSTVVASWGCRLPSQRTADITLAAQSPRSYHF